MAKAKFSDLRRFVDFLRWFPNLVGRLPRAARLHVVSACSRLERATRFFRHWRVAMAAGSVISFIVLILNLSLLAWTVAGPFSDDGHGVYTVFDLSCNQIDPIERWSLLGINALNALLLGTSYYAMQILGTPTREEVDQAHARGVWLDIGVMSWRNVKWIGLWRVAEFVVLMLSSAIIHFQ